jgi:hypothetical protein
MKESDAIEFLDSQRVEALLSRPPGGEKVGMIAVLVPPDVLIEIEKRGVVTRFPSLPNVSR